MECCLAILFDFSSNILLRDTGQEPSLHDTKPGAQVDIRTDCGPKNDGRLMRKSQLDGLEMSEGRFGTEIVILNLYHVVPKVAKSAVTVDGKGLFEWSGLKG